MQWKVWLRGLISAAVGGAANAAAAVYVAPDTFNFSGEGFVKLLQLAGAGALIALLGYLKQSPLPPEKKLKVGGIASLLFIAFLLFSSACHKQIVAPHPASLDAFDSQTYDALLVAQGVLDQAKIEYQQGKLAESAKPLINKTGDAYNLARDLWLEYRAVVEAGKSGDVVSDVQAKVDAAVFNLGALVRDLNVLLGAKGGSSELRKSGGIDERLSVGSLHHRNGPGSGQGVCRREARGEFRSVGADRARRVSSLSC